MKIRKIAAIMAALCILPSANLSAYAETPNGSMTIAIEKFTLGQGYIFQPENIPIYKGDTGADVLERAYGKTNFNNGNGIDAYISSVHDYDRSSIAIPEFITDAARSAEVEIDSIRNNSEWTGSLDFCSMSGWMYFINNESPVFSLSEYQPKDGDVLRLAFSVYGYGSDIGIDNTSWGGSAPLCPTVDRDELTKELALCEISRLNFGVRTRGLKVAENLLSTQEDYDRTALELRFVRESGFSMGDVNKSKKVDIFDAVMVAKSTVGMLSLDEKESLLADMNGDFKVDIFDAVEIAKYTVSQ